MTSSGNNQQPQLVITTCASEHDAEKIAHTLVEKKLAACVSIVPGVKSVYQWQGKIEHSQEVLILIKTDAQHYKPLEKQLKNIHPYELPEILAVTVDTGSRDYLHWITTCLD